MKYAWLAVLAGCSSGWTPKTPDHEPEPDSRTEYATVPAATPAQRVATKQVCTAPPHAGTAGVTLVVANGSTFVHDLCLATDQSLGLLPTLAGLAGFELEVTLGEVKLSGVHVKCQVSVAVRATTTIIGVFAQVVSAQASSTKLADLESSKRDCVDANIDDLVRQRAVPAIKRHATASLPSTNP